MGHRPKLSGRMLGAAARVARSPVVGEGVKRLVLARIGAEPLLTLTLDANDAPLPLALVPPGHEVRGGRSDRNPSEGA